MAGSYLPLSGVGGRVNINNTLLAVDHWRVHWETNVIPSPSFTGGKWMEYCLGKTTGFANFSGTWDGTYNPNANQIKTGLLCAANFYLSPLISNTALEAIIQSFDVEDVADDKTYYTCNLIFNYSFYDFSGATA